MIEKYREIIEKQHSLIAELVQCVNMQEVADKIAAEKKELANPVIKPIYNPVEIEILIEYWCQYYVLDRDKLYSPCREEIYKTARYFVFWALRNQVVPNTFTFAQIGKLFNRDHSTAIYGVRAMDGWLTYDKVLRSDLIIMLDAFGYEAEFNEDSKALSWSLINIQEV